VHQTYVAAKNAHRQQLMKQYAVTMSLEPLRLKVDAEGHPSKGPAAERDSRDPAQGGLCLLVRLGQVGEFPSCL